MGKYRKCMNHYHTKTYSQARPTEIAFAGFQAIFKKINTFFATQPRHAMHLAQQSSHHKNEQQDRLQPFHLAAALMEKKYYADKMKARHTHGPRRPLGMKYCTANHTRTHTAHPMHDCLDYNTLCGQCRPTTHASSLDCKANCDAKWYNRQLCAFVYVTPSTTAGNPSTHG